jgi:hypothetical protein
LKTDIESFIWDEENEEELFQQHQLYQSNLKNIEQVRI